MNNHLYNFLSVLLLFTSIFLSCSGQKVESFEFPIDGKLVYVEGLRGEGWISANPFGELVMLDSPEQQRHILTWDEYYYAHPNLTSNKKSIIFESKRDRNIRMIGLSAESDIYRMDFETGQITNINEELSKMIGQPLGRRISHSSLSPTGQKLALVRYVNWQFHLSYIDLESGDIFDLSTNEEFSPYTSSVIEWSPDEKHIIFSRIKGFSTSAVLMSLKERTIKIVEVELDEIKKYGGVSSCTAGSWADNYRFIFHCKRAEMNYTDIYEFDLRKESAKVIASINLNSFNNIIGSLKISKDEEFLLFIGENLENSEIDIWKMKIDKGEFFRITNNGQNKAWLRWYEDL